MMSELYTVRPLQRSIPETALEGGFRVHLLPKELKHLSLEAGDACRLSSQGGASGVGIAWPSQDLKPQGERRIARVSDIFRESYGFNFQDRVTITKAKLDFPRVDMVIISELSEIQHETSDPIPPEALECWIRVSLLHLDVIVPGGSFELRDKDSKRSRKRRFMINEVVPKLDNIKTYYFDFDSKIQFMGQMPIPEPQTFRSQVFRLDSKGLGGLNKQISIINGHLDSLLSQDQHIRTSAHLKRNGILLYGSEGTGKSLLLKKLAKAGWKKVLFIDETTLGPYVKESHKALLKIFADARASQPSLIVLDDLTVIAGKEDDNSNHTALKSLLIAELETIQGTQVVAAGATFDLNAIDKRLRTIKTFGVEVEIPVPDADARADILKVLLNKPYDSPDALCDALGQITHGYVGKDLEMLCSVARDQAVRTYQPRGNDLTGTPAESGVLPTKVPEATTEGADEAPIPMDVDLITEEDLRRSLLQVRPTAMKEVFLETPKVRWADIGGSDEVKRALYKVTERPFKRPDVLRGLNIEPQKGILLYGPPGCSKTLTAKALATEAGLNFLAVKGAELTSMYVGESERAIREIFRKARAASPSIIFFDEIDSIGAASEKGSHTTGLNVVTTLLNEMDGIESLRGVLVLAATNKPEILDAALLRPGRFDTLLYVGPPNLEARKQILRIGLRDRETTDDIDIDELAIRCEGFSGAEIINICTQAAEATADDREREDNNDLKISQQHFDRVLQGFKTQITGEMTRKYEEWRDGGVLRT